MFDVYSRSREITSEGLRIVVADHGPSDGDAVVLIHGWPDSAKLWRHQVPVLADAGYRVMAPDLPGFGMSDMPTDVSAYRLSALASHLIAMLDDAGLDTVHIVGHDWGAALGWYLALMAPHRLETLTALSVGHPLAFRRAGPGQLRRSWYMLLFQFEDVAETWLAGDDWANFRALGGGHPETDGWISDLSRPNALTASLGVYRANMSPDRLVAPEPELPQVRLPVLGIWSSNDFALTESQMTGSAEFVEGQFRYERIEDASHWIPLDAPNGLNQLLLGWLDSPRQ